MKRKPAYYYLILCLIAASFILIGGDDDCDDEEENEREKVQAILSKNKLPTAARHVELFLKLQEELLKLEQTRAGANVDDKVIQLIKNKQAFIDKDGNVVFLDANRVHPPEGDGGGGSCMPNGAAPCTSNADCCSNNCVGAPSGTCSP